MRKHQQSITDSEDPMDGTDTLTMYLNSKEANAFNWVWLNAHSGTHAIAVKASLDTSTEGTATTDGYVGNRVLVVGPTKLANNAVV